MKNKSLTIKRKTFSNLLDTLNSDNCVLVLTLASIVVGLLLISILIGHALLPLT